MINGHGDDLHNFYDGLIRVNFSTNIVSEVDHQNLYDHLRSVMGKISSYPEPTPFSLEKEITEHFGIDSGCVTVTNGATDAIYRIASFSAGRNAAVLRPSFREYQDACMRHHCPIHFIDTLSEILDNDSTVWICNPNNPTGKVFPKEKLLASITLHKDKLWVIDQAYADYTSLPVITPQEAVDFGNVILLSSLTKRFTVPGLRVGYAVASPDFSCKIKEEAIPWEVNSLAIEAGKYLLRHESDYMIDCEALHRNALTLKANLESIGIGCSQTDCNFFLCRLPHGDAAHLKKFLAEKHGMLIRDASNFESLTSSHFRVATQGEEADAALAEAIREYLDGLYCEAAAR